jgi:hypothetical protein
MDLVESTQVKGGIIVAKKTLQKPKKLEQTKTLIVLR